MGSFGNSWGAIWGGEYNNSEVTYDGPDLLDQNGKLVQLPDPLSDPNQAPDPGRYKPDSGQLGAVPTLLSDDASYQDIEKELHRPGGLNWENSTFTALRQEKEALQPDKLDTLATAWKAHGERLQTSSKTFKNLVSNTISEKWWGESAGAAAVATQQVTKTSIYDFTPSSTALSERLSVLSAAFKSIQHRWDTEIKDPDGELIDSGNFNKQKLDQELAEFNSKYHLDGGGHLRNNSNGYVAASQAVDEMNKLKRSTSDYQAAVQLFRDTYNPTVEAVTADFPNLPPAPDMTFGQPPPPPGPGGPGGGGGSPFGGGGGGPAPIGAPNMPAIPSTPQIPTDPNAGPASPLSGLQNAGEFAEMAGQAASQAASQASQALGQAVSAAQRVGTGAPSNTALSGAGNAHGMPPEGVLGLGSAGGKGALGKIGGAGGGVGAPSPSIGKPAGAPATAAGRAADRTVAAASRAGLGGAAGPAGAGMPGAGAPAAGQHGAAAPGGQYQPNKALRRKQNGEELIGEAEAVPAVLGEPARPDAPKPRSEARKSEAT